MDLVRERRVPLGDKLWAELQARAEQHGLNVSEAITSAVLQWLTLPEGRCPQCGAKLCPATDHHEDWCHARGSLDISPQPRVAAREVPEMLRSVLLRDM